MSLAGISTGGNISGSSPLRQPYFCHQCNRTVLLPPPPPPSDPICPICSGEFLEEQELPTPIPIPIPNLDPLFNPFSPFASFPNHQNPRNGPDPILDYVQQLRARGVEVELVIENRLSAANLGDYYVGPGLEQLIQHLAENDPNRHGTPPASKLALLGLPTVTITEEVLKSDLAQCAVCKDEFELGTEVKQMPCKHLYHEGCIMPWLEMHNSCPVCRYELPTDDPDYENGNAEDGSGGDLSPLPRSLERRNRIRQLFGLGPEEAGSAPQPDS